jgi:RNA polymerase sigma-70 factor, ECF subfamily
MYERRRGGHQSVAALALSFALVPSSAVATTPLSPVPDRLPQLPAAGRPPLPAEQSDAIDEDFRLARRLVTGDPVAWRTLLQRFGRLVLARAMATAREFNRPLSQTDAEDLCAEVFSRLIDGDYAALKRFEGRSTLSTWLSVVTRRIVLRRLSVAARELSFPAREHPSLEAIPGPDTEQPLAIIISDEDRALLTAGIARLGERQRQLARLFYIERKSYREISEALQMPVNSIGPTLARIHEKLRAAMKQEEP